MELDKEALKNFTKDKMAKIIQNFIMVRLGLSKTVEIEQDEFEFFLFYNKSNKEYEFLREFWIQNRKLDTMKRDYNLFYKEEN